MPVIASRPALTSVSMFFRNFIILAIFAYGAIRTAAIPLAAMSLVAAYWVYRGRNRAADIRKVCLQIPLPLRLAIYLIGC